MARSIPVLLLTVLGIVLASCRDDASVTATSEPPQIEMKGMLEAAQSLTVVAQLDGTVGEVSVREGDSVAAGAPLVRLMNPGLERELELSRAELARATAAPVRRSADVPFVSKGRRETLERIVAIRKDRLERYRALRASRDVSQQEVDAAEAEYLAALRELSAETDAPRSVVMDRVNPADVERARAEERYAAGRLAQLRVATPLAGFVTKVHVVNGQAVFPRDPLVDITNTSVLHARGEVAPELARYVRPGTRVEVKVFSVPPKTFTASVDRVTPGQNPAGGARTAAVFATIANPDHSLQPNTPVSMTVRTAR